MQKAPEPKNGSGAFCQKSAAFLKKRFALQRTRLQEQRVTV